jgi:hypothetical protein
LGRQGWQIAVHLHRVCHQKLWGACLFRSYVGSCGNNDGIMEVLLCFLEKKVPGKSIHLMAEKQTRDVASIAGKLRDFDLICIKKLKCCFMIILQFDLILENVGKLQDTERFPIFLAYLSMKKAFLFYLIIKYLLQIVCARNIKNLLHLINQVKSITIPNNYIKKMKKTYIHT